MNSISEAERPKRSRVAPSEAIPTFLPFPRPQTQQAQELQGKTNLSKEFLFIQRFISQPWVALCCADTAKMFLLTEIEILFSEWSSEAEQRFYCSPDINKAQHTIREWTVWDILSPEFNLRCKKWTLLLPPPPPVSGVGKVGCLSMAGWWLFSCHHQNAISQSEAAISPVWPIRGQYSLTFLPPSVLPLMGHRQDYYYAGARTGKLNLDNVVKCLLIVSNVDLDSRNIGSDLVSWSINSSW